MMGRGREGILVGAGRGVRWGGVDTGRVREGGRNGGDRSGGVQGRSFR